MLAFRVLPNRLRLQLWRIALLGKRLFRRAPLLTVIVPVYNVVEYLEESLVSLRNQTLLDMQIIAVDDGSTDGSGELLDSLALQDPRIEVIHQTNAGLGAARNSGLVDARGRFVTFMDPDDLIPSTAYALMVDTLARTGSDFVVGRIVRYKNGKYIMPAFSKQVHEFDRFGTTISEFPDALMDIIACNRMFDREFWFREIGLFPEGVAYEDHVPVTAAYLRASTFDILHTTTYDWRIREDGTSIGQQKHQIQNLKDRLLAKYDAWDVIREYPDEHVRMAWIGRVLGMDLPAFVLPAVDADPEYRAELRKAIDFFAGLVTDDSAFDMAGTYNKVLLWFAKADRWDLIEDALQEVRDLGHRLPTTIIDGRIVADPAQLGPLLSELPASYLWSSKFELSPVAVFESLGWESDGGVRLAGWTNLAMVDMREHPQELTVSLVSESGDVRLAGRTVRHETERSNYYSGHKHSDYFQASFETVWDGSEVKRLLAAGGTFAVELENSAEGILRRSWFNRSARDSSRELRLWRSDRGRTFAWISNERGLVLSRKRPKKDLYSTDSIRLGRLRRSLDTRFVSVTDVAIIGDHLEVSLRSPFGERVLRSAVLAAPQQSVSLSPTDVRAAGGRTWTLTFPLSHDPWKLGETRLPNGRYTVQLFGAVARVHPDLLRRFPISLKSDRLELYPTSGRFLDFSLHFNDADLRTRATALQRHRSITQHAAGGQQLRHAVLFQCYLGEQIGDSPLEICKELQRRGSDLELYWGVANYSVRVPEGTTALRVNSPEWFEVLSTAKYLCNNVDFPEWFVRQPAQEFIETFHGQPFKQMGLQHWIQNGSSEERIAAQIARRQRAWTRMLLPHDEAVPWYEAAYPGAGTLTVLGLPRNDSLTVPDPTIAARVRSVLGVAAESRLIMYAPTWRETLATSGWTADAVDFISLGELARQLGPEYTIMYRGHNFNVRNGEHDRGGASVVDASRYPDINHLIQAADMAILDYSSLRFDFAITNKPMVFLVPDEQEYFELRPGLLPFRETAPGPLVHDPGKLAETVRAMFLDEDLRGESLAQLAAFNARFNANQDGRATARVVDAVFAGDGAAESHDESAR